MYNILCKWINIAVLMGCLILIGVERSAVAAKHCRFAPGLTVGNRARELECCDKVFRDFARFWASGSRYLSTLLESMRGWNCSQYLKECQAPTYAYNDFTRLLYARFCNHTALEQQCFDDFKSVVDKNSDSTSNLSTWKQAVNAFDASKVDSEDLMKPCIQIAMYEIDSGGHGHYHEVVAAFLPFCSFIWCGFDEKIVESKDISITTCMPQRCYTSMLAIMVICGILAVTVVLCNTTIIVVFVFNRYLLWNGQAVYRLSLASADVLAGLVVFPTFISSLYKLTIVKHDLGDLRNVTGYTVVDGNVNSSQSVELRGVGGLFQDRFSRSYLDAVGIFTILTLSVSVFTLVAAGIDRFVAIFRPLKYKQKTAKLVAIITAIIIWVLGLVFSTVPLYVRNMRYGLVASILVSSSGTAVIILYAFAFLIPLLVMWCISIATCITSKKYIQEWRELPGTDRRKQEGKIEMRLVKTLGIMVGTFTLCLLPAAIILLIPLFLTNIYYNDPENLNQASASRYTAAELAVVILLMSNSLWNCFIYGTRDDKFRGAAAKMYFQIAHSLKLDVAWKKVGGQNVGLCINRHRSSRLPSDDTQSDTEATRVVNTRGHLDINETTAI